MNSRQVKTCGRGLSMIAAAALIAACGSDSSSSNGGDGGNGGEQNGGPVLPGNGGASSEFTVSLVKDIFPGGNANPEELTSTPQGLYFITSEQIMDFLWLTDGTTEGTREVFDPDSVPGINSLRDLTFYDGRLYFVAGSRLRSTTGESETPPLVDPNRILRPRSITSALGFMFFKTQGELWRSDGTAEGTQPHSDINPDGDAVENNISYTLFQDELYFRATNGTDGFELYATDGSDNGVRRVANINPDGSSAPSSVTPVSTAALGDFLIFAATDDRGGELWRSDGTENGTVFIKDLNPGSGSSPSGFTQVGENIVFSAVPPGNPGFEPTFWVTDGTSEGTQQISDVIRRSPMVVYNGHAYFGGRDASTGNVAVWRSDGTASGTEAFFVADGSAASPPSSFTVFNDKLFFVADSGSSSGSNAQLWVTDGTTSGTVEVKPDNATVLDPLDDGFGHSELVEHDGALYFKAEYTLDGRELWKVTP